MDYTVGSLADLISGNSTPNKIKIRKIPVEQNVTLENKIGKKKKLSNSSLEQESNNQTIVSKEKRKKRKLSSSNDDVPEEIKKSKKNKTKSLDKNDEDSPEPALKKKKNKKHKASAESSFVDSDEEQESEEQNQNNTEKVDKKVKKIPDPEEQARTIFVGNIPINSKKKQIKSFFKKYGPIESLRFRGIPVADPKIPKKVAAITKEFHPDRSSIFCYIRFMEKEDAQKAVAENGNVFQEHHLRVQSCGSSEKMDECKAIFIGNLNFRAEEEQLWKLFESCGPISSVRIIRDSHTGMGKGFAYVNFKDVDAVQLALEMENVKLGDRELRIKLSSASNAKKNKKKENKTNATRRLNMNQKENGLNKNGAADKDHPEKKYKSFVTNNNKSFQGATFNNKKKKFKANKADLEKKRKIKNIAPISK